MFMVQLQSAAAVLLVAIGLVAATTGVLAARGVPAAPPAPARPEGPGPDADAGAKAGADTGKPIRSLPGHKDRLTSVAYAPDGTSIATASWDGTARIWDAQTGKEVVHLDPPATADYNPPMLSQVLFSPDNQFVVTAQQALPNESGVIVWNRRTGERVRDFPGECAAFAPDGKHLACGGPNVRAAPVRLYEFATGKLVRELHGQQDQVKSLTFARDGNTLFATGPLPRPPGREGGPERLGHMPHVFRAWDVATGKERRSTLRGADVLQRQALSPDGRTLANAGTLVEIATGGGRGLLTDPVHKVYGVAFSPDGRTLATGGEDGTVRLWDLPSGKELGCFGKVADPSKPGWVIAVAFSPDGRTLVSGGLDIAKGGRIPSTARLWDVSRITGRQRAVAERSAAELEADWKDLAGDSVAGYAALGRLVSSPAGAVAFLGKQLQSIKPVDPKRLERLLAALDSAKFAVREQATRELKALAEHAVPALRTALSGQPSLETRRRLETLLDRLDGAPPSAETVRQIRAVEALEFIGNPEARRLLAQLAAGPPATHLAQEAKESLGRLAKRATPVP
jgi:WD40 repeat protein